MTHSTFFIIISTVSSSCRVKMFFRPFMCLALASSLALSQKPTDQGATAANKKPNIIFFLTDDQDRQLGSLDYMEAVKRNLMSEGTTFERHYCTNALCCPSRASLLTGKLPHNTNVTDLELPFGTCAPDANPSFTYQNRRIRQVRTRGSQ